MLKERLCVLSELLRLSEERLHHLFRESLGYFRPFAAHCTVYIFAPQSIIRIVPLCATEGL